MFDILGTYSDGGVANVVVGVVNFVCDWSRFGDQLFFLIHLLFLFNTTEHTCHLERYSARSSHHSCSHPHLTCDEIRQLRIGHFLGHGEFKITFLTKYNNITYALRMAAHSGFL
jgi:hypothetical protein